MSQGNITYDKEKVSFNLARLKKNGEVFEVVVDPDLAIDFKESQRKGHESTLDLREILKSEEIFKDAHKGELAPAHEFQEIFGTDDELEIAKRILTEGEIQITSEHRAKIRERKRKKIVDIIHRNGVDPRTNLPHPAARIESALEDAKVKIDEFKKAENQVDDILHKLKVVLPIRFENKKIQIKVYQEHAAQLYGFFKQWNMIKENWNSDGSLTVVVDIPAGLQNDFYDKLNDLTQGGNETTIVD